MLRVMSAADLLRDITGEVSLLKPLPQPDPEPVAPVCTHTAAELVDVIRAIGRFTPVRRTGLADVLGISRKDVAELLRQAYAADMVTGQRCNGEVFLEARTCGAGSAE